jgi:serine/threonine-protein kinase HipA
MTKIKNCLICYQPLAENQKLYHPKCSKKLFGQSKAPDLPYANDELKKLAQNVVRSRITIPGVQAKLSLHLDKNLKKNSRFTLVGLWGNFILKPPLEAYPFMPEIEHLTMHLAELFQIDAVPHGLIPLKSGEIAYITRRIDRLPDGEKLHMEDMCQLTERLTEDKYRGSMEQIGRIVQKLSSNPIFYTIRLFEIALFSFITGNADMHLKNFSLIYPLEGMVNLSATYDMLATRLLIPEKDDPEELALTLNGKKRKFTHNDFHCFAAHLGLNERQINNVFNRFSKVIPEMGSVIDRGFLPQKKTDEFKQLIKERAERLELWEGKRGTGS